MLDLQIVSLKFEVIKFNSVLMRSFSCNVSYHTPPSMGAMVKMGVQWLSSDLWLASLKKSILLSEGVLEVPYH